MSSKITAEDIADAVDWLGGWGDDIEFSSSQKLKGDDGEFSGDVYLEGKVISTGQHVFATYRLSEATLAEPDPVFDDDEGEWV